jgi:hypothetical protein
MTRVVTSRVEARGADAAVDEITVDVDAPNGLERAVVESKAACMRRLNALMGADAQNDDDDDDDDDDEDEEEEDKA